MEQRISPAALGVAEPARARLVRGIIQFAGFCPAPARNFGLEWTSSSLR